MRLYFYLKEHGLIDATTSSVKYGGDRLLVDVAINCRGIDFLEDDGGLSAILGVVTVRLHADTIRDMVEAKILASDAPEPYRDSRRLQTLRGWSHEHFQAICT